jgi:hypothetical protein
MNVACFHEQKSMFYQLQSFLCEWKKCKPFETIGMDPVIVLILLINIYAI